MRTIEPLRPFLLPIPGCFFSLLIRFFDPLSIDNCIRKEDSQSFYLDMFEIELTHLRFVSIYSDVVCTKAACPP